MQCQPRGYYLPSREKRHSYPTVLTSSNHGHPDEARSEGREGRISLPDAATQRTLTVLTPAGRQIVTVLDVPSRVVQVQPAELDPVSLTHDWSRPFFGVKAIRHRRAPLRPRRFRARGALGPQGVEGPQDLRSHLGATLLRRGGEEGGVDEHQTRAFTENRGITFVRRRLSVNVRS